MDLTCLAFVFRQKNPAYTFALDFAPIPRAIRHQSGWGARDVFTCGRRPTGQVVILVNLVVAVVVEDCHGINFFI